MVIVVLVSYSAHYTSSLLLSHGQLQFVLISIVMLWLLHL